MHTPLPGLDHPPITVLSDLPGTLAPPAVTATALVPTPVATATVPVPSPVATQLAAETALEAAAQAESDARFDAQVDAKLAEQREMAAENAARGSGSRHPAPLASIRAASTGIVPTGRFDGVEIVTRRPRAKTAEPAYVEFELSVSTSFFFARLFC